MQQSGASHKSLNAPWLGYHRPLRTLIVQDLIGRTLGHYRIVEKIGEGGMGVVYRANDERLDREVAIKVLPEHLAKDPARRERFEREARAVSSLNHPNICTLHDIGQHDGIDFIVMEYIEGDTLAGLLENGAWPLERALQVGVQIADGLDKAHCRGIVHRDLKPGNIMLTKNGAKLLDFGLAKLAAPDSDVVESALATEDEPLTAEGTLVGTAQYMAPKQLEGKEADARTDVFAFGAVLYEMITGNKAFEGKSRASLISAIMSSEPRRLSNAQAGSPPALDRTVAKCLAKDPDERWLAYMSNESGRYEVYVQDYPGAGEKITVSTDGGYEPEWSPDGRELFYRVGARVMAVSIQTTPVFRSSRPIELFEGPYISGSTIAAIATTYDVAPDGQHFLMIEGSAEKGGNQLHLVLNWFEELEMRVLPDGK